MKKIKELIYATCPTLPEENFHVIKLFLKETDDAKEILIDVRWGEKQKHGRKISPDQNQMDGFC